jgi:hypothetical protein
MRAATSEFGTFRTWRDVRLESVMHSKADIVTSSLIGPSPASGVTIDAPSDQD